MATTDVRGVRVHYDARGSGAPLLLLSGLGQSSLVWDPVVGLLQDRFTCITMDNRGTGRSSIPPGPYRIDDMADDVAGLLEHLELGPVSVVGWSLGGSVLQSLLIRHAERVTRAVLLSAFPSYTDVQHAWLDAGLALRRSGLDPVTIATYGMAWGYTPRMLSDHESLAQQAARIREDPWPTSLAGFEAQAEGLRIYESQAGLPEVQVPTLVLTGAEDVLTPLSQAVEMAALLPRGRLHVLPRGGHGMVLEYPDDTVRAVIRFLTSNTDSDPTGGS